MVKKNAIDLIIARGSPAGALVYLLHKKLKVDYVVESFEPHADYMRYSGIWSKYGVKYYFQKRWEEGQMKTALELYTVSENYKLHLIKLGGNKKEIKVMPCAINLDKMRFDQKARTKIRDELHWSEAIIGIYTGKFGGLYYTSESFKLFKTAFDEFGDKFRLIILTSAPKDWVIGELQMAGAPIERTLVEFVEHKRVNEYLSAADFSFAPIKNSAVSKFCSAVKIGESWSIGLPVLLTEGIGDDSRIILNYGGGVIFEPTGAGISKAVIEMRSLVDKGVNKNEIQGLARSYRSYDTVAKIYTELLYKEINV